MDYVSHWGHAIFEIKLIFLTLYVVIHGCVNILEIENRLEWPQEDDLTIAATITLFENRGEIVYHSTTV